MIIHSGSAIATEALQCPGEQVVGIWGTSLFEASMLAGAYPLVIGIRHVSLVVHHFVAAKTVFPVGKGKEGEASLPSEVLVTLRSGLLSAFG